jgi:cytochrome c5
VNKFAIALLLGTVFAVGCGDKTDTAGSASAKASGAASTKASASGASTTTAAAGGAKNCDDYWTKLKACNEAALKGAPDATKEAMKKGFEDAEKQTKEGWKAMDEGTMNTACKTMLDTLASNPNCPK